MSSTIRRRFSSFISIALGPTNSHLTLVVAAIHTSRFIDRRCFLVVIEHILGDGIVHAAHTVRRSIVNDELILELLQAELVSDRVSFLGSLESMRERVVNFRLHFQKRARGLA